MGRSWQRTRDRRLRLQGEGGLVSSKLLQMAFKCWINSFHSPFLATEISFIYTTLLSPLTSHLHTIMLIMLRCFGMVVKARMTYSCLFSPSRQGLNMEHRLALNLWSSCQVLGIQACTHCALACKGWDVFELLHTSTSMLVCTVTFAATVLGLCPGSPSLCPPMDWGLFPGNLVALYPEPYRGTVLTHCHVCTSYSHLHCRFLKKGPSLSLRPNNEVSTRSPHSQMKTQTSNLC